MNGAKATCLYRLSRPRFRRPRSLQRRRRLL